MATEPIKQVFHNYPIFRIHRSSATKQSVILVSLFTVLFVGTSIFEHTLLLSGKDTGLLEHPTTWAFLLIQFTAPVFLTRALEKLFCFLKKNSVIDTKKELSEYAAKFRKETLRQTNFSKFSFSLLTLIGFACFIWNSFQNQAPMKFLGFDFWDSSNHQLGYWLTRGYKLYLWVFFLPTIIHIHISILSVLYKLLKDAERNKFFVLRPYNQDEHAGVGIIIKIAINPALPILLLGSVSVLGAFFVHGQIGVTPVIGLCILSSLFLVVYLIPAIQLRKIIKTEKKLQLTEIAEKQNSIYFSLIGKEKSKVPSDDLEELNSLTIIYDQVKSISIWPYWKSMLKLIGVINIPLLLSLGKTLWPFVKSKWP